MMWLGKGPYGKWAMCDPLVSALISGYHTPHVSVMGQIKTWESATWSVRWPTSGIEPSSLPPSLKPQWKIFWGLRLNTRDKLMQKENKPQEFTVKIAYQVALWLNHPPSEEHSSVAQDQGLWKRLWSLNVPTKVWTFMWRACYNVLPTKSKLARQKVQIDPKCFFRGQKDETTESILWECPFSSNV